MIKNILVCVSGSVNSMNAAKYAICLAKIFNAKIFAVYVINSSILGELLKNKVFVEMEARNYEHDLQQQGKLLLERVKKLADSKQVSCEVELLKGDVCEEVINRVPRLKADILVMGEIKEIVSRADIFHNEGERIARRAACPVVLVRNQAIVENLFKEII